MFDLMLRSKTPLKQYNLIATATNWTTSRAVGVPYQTLDGAWRIQINISGSMTSASRTNFVMTIQGITYAKCGGDGQVMSCVAPNGAVVAVIYTADNASTFTIYHASATTTTYAISGDVELASKPLFVQEN